MPYPHKYNRRLNLSCSSSQVFPEPKLSLSWYSEPYYAHHTEDMTTTMIRRGLLYDVSVTTIMASSLPHQTVFSCSMEIPGTILYLNKKTMYNPSSRDRATASKVSSGSSFFSQSFAALSGCVIWLVYRISYWNNANTQ